MIVFDTDIFSAIYRGDSRVLDRLKTVQTQSHAITIVTVEEVSRGYLNSIRKAESNRAKISLAQTYQFFETGMRALESFDHLLFTDVSQRYFDTWRKENRRIGTYDLRIAAICKTHNAELVTRNAKDFRQVPEFNFQIWD